MHTSSPSACMMPMAAYKSCGCRLCAFEATKVKVQTVPGFANGLSDGLPKIVQQEGIGGCVLPSAFTA
jgi:hypothetical protein